MDADESRLKEFMLKYFETKSCDKFCSLLFSYETRQNTFNDPEVRQTIFELFAVAGFKTSYREPGKVFGDERVLNEKDNPVDLEKLTKLFEQVKELPRVAADLMVKEAEATCKSNKRPKTDEPYIWLKYALNKIGRDLGLCKKKTLIMYGDIGKRRWCIQGVKGGQRDAKHFNDLLELAYMRRPVGTDNWELFKQRSTHWDDIRGLRSFELDGGVALAQHKEFKNTILYHIGQKRKRE